MSFKCLDCGHIFDEGEQSVWEESHGLDTPPYEKMSGCPLCRGDYEKASRCIICGSVHLDDELNSGVCDDCVEKYNYDVDMCYKIGSNSTEEIELNCFLVSMFDKSEIEAILYRELKEAQKNCMIDCGPFIRADRDWFAERLGEEVKNNEDCEG